MLRRHGSTVGIGYQEHESQPRQIRRRWTRRSRRPPAFLELGVNNLWKSAGSLVIWRRGERIPDKDELDAKLRQHAPQLLLAQPKEIMLEIGYSDPQPHWAGLYASRRQGDSYWLDLDEALQMALAVAAAGPQGA